MDANWLSTGNSHPASSLRGLLWNGPSARSIGLSIQYEPLVESYHARLSLSLPSEGLSSAAIREESRPNPGRPAPMCRLLLRSAIPCCPEVACFDQCHHFGVVLWQVTCLVKVHVKMRYNCSSAALCFSICALGAEVPSLFSLFIGLGYAAAWCRDVPFFLQFSDCPSLLVCSP